MTNFFIQAGTMALAAALVALVIGCGRDDGPAPIPATEVPKAIIIAEVAPTATRTATAVPTLTPKPTTTATSSPTAVPTLTPTPTPTDTPTNTPVPTSTNIPTPTATHTHTPTVTRADFTTASPTPTPSLTPTPTVTPTPTITPTPEKLCVLDYVKWEIGDKVPSDYRNEAIQGVQLAHDYAASLGIPKPKDEITIHMYKDVDKLASAYAKARNRSIESARTSVERNVGIAFENQVFMSVFRSFYSNNEPKYRTKVIAHELFHMYQNDLDELGSASGPDGVPEFGPIWLREGIAEHLAYMSLSEGEILSYESERNSFVENSIGGDKPLNEMETRGGFQDFRGSSYQYALLGAEFLASLSGEESLIDYHRFQHEDATWQDAFENAFDMTVEDFYELFEEHRAAGFPEVYIPPSYVKWEIGDEVSEEDRENAKLAVQLMHDYTVSAGLPKVGKDITFHLYHDNDALVAAYAKAAEWTIENSRRLWRPDGAVGNGGKGWAFANTAHTWIRESRVNFVSLIAGEFNNAQKAHWSELRLDSSSDEVPESGPRWLSSGATGFLVRQVMSEAGLKPYHAERLNLVSRAQRVDVPLSAMETWTGFTAARLYPYEYSHLAGELLAHHAGRSALMRYYTLLKRGTAWQDAFQATFGMTVEEFYELFEEHRAAGFPVVDIPNGDQP